MEDRELLEMAAKAVGIARSQWDYDWVRGLGHMVCRSNMWNPLADDGDALRLAAKLGLILCTEPRSVYAHTIKGLGIEAYASQGGPDHMSNIRRAITRAAAEIGKSMP